MPRKINRGSDRKVYAASAWWENSDPFITVVGFDPKRVSFEIDRYLDNYMEEQLRNDDNFSSIEEIESQIKWSGVHAYNLSDIVPDARRAMTALLIHGILFV
jgi:hypothetical protein